MLAVLQRLYIKYRNQCMGGTGGMCPLPPPPPPPILHLPAQTQFVVSRETVYRLIGITLGLICPPPHYIPSSREKKFLYLYYAMCWQHSILASNGLLCITTSHSIYSCRCTVYSCCVGFRLQTYTSQQL